MQLNVTADLVTGANPWLVRATFLDWQAWPLFFPKIHGVRLVQASPDERLVTVDVDHDEGTVRNWLQSGPGLRADLWEDKRRYRAHFANTFTPTGATTLCTVRGDVAVPVWSGALAPVVRRYAARLLTRSTLRPLCEAAADLRDRLDVRSEGGNAGCSLRARSERRISTRWQSGRLRDLVCDYTAASAWLLLDAADPHGGQVLERIDCGGVVGWQRGLRSVGGPEPFEALFPEPGGTIRVLRSNARSIAVSALDGRVLP